MTQGVITLLYKGKGARSSLDNYRPITLLNSDYKLLAKALATRLGPALQHVIDPTQTAFVPGRWIGDNVLFFFFFFLGYRIVVHSFQAKEPSGHQTNLRYAGTTA